MAKLRFGTGGFPLTTKEKGTVGGIKRIRELGLDHLELEFVHSVFIKPEQTEEVKKSAEENDVSLSIHGSYYINLASPDKQKWHASISRVVQAAKIGVMIGAQSVTYHSGFYQKQDPEDVFELIKEGTIKVIQELKDKQLQIKISPEVTGKRSQFSGPNDLMKLVQAIRDEGLEDYIAFCFDFAHQYARNGGQYNSYDEFSKLLDDIASNLGEDFLRQLHMHISGIEYGDKGEKNHLLFLQSLDAYAAAGVKVEGIEEHFQAQPEKRLKKNEFNWQDLLKALKKHDVGGFVVCESPILELDALLMQQYYQSL